MLMAIRSRLGRKEEGFTLIELMVVVLIIAILIAIAVPTFLGARQKAQNRAAQADLRNALVAAKTMYTDTNSYATADNSATGLTTVEPSLVYVAAATASDTSTRKVSVSAAAGEWAAARMSASGTCFFIDETAATGTTYGSTTTALDCTGTQALTAAGTSW